MKVKVKKYYYENFRLIFESLTVIMIFSSLIISIALIQIITSEEFIGGSTEKMGYSFGLFLSILAGIILIYGSYIQPRRIKITRINVHNPYSETPLTIAFLSDFHFGPYKSDNFGLRLTKLVNELTPDIIILGGDYICTKNEEAKHIQSLKGLKPRIGIYAVMGNHDYIGVYMPINRYPKKEQPKILNKAIKGNKRVQELLLEIKAKVIDGKQLLIEDHKLNIIGLKERYIQTSPNEVARKAVTDMSKEGYFNLLISHNPDVIKSDPLKKVQLILSGHTHGGQIRLPIIGSIYPIPTETKKNYTHGIYTIESHENQKTEEQASPNFIISEGLGESGPRARLFSTPEIILINLN